MYKYLNFFDKNGQYLNFAYNATTDKWTGAIDFNVISEGLIEDFQIYVLEQVWNPDTNTTEYSWPMVDVSYLPGPSSFVGSSGATSTSIGLTASFSPTGATEHFVYDFVIGGTSDNQLVKYYNYGLEFIYDAGMTALGASSNYPDMKSTTEGLDQAMQINLAFHPSDENKYENKLYLIDGAGVVFAEIDVYGEGEEEDERLTDMLQSLGYDLLPEDFRIFDSTDVFEESPDWRLLNRKRRELLLEHHNIFPYVGSYKALINILKYFGYQNVRLKEYWLNVDETSKNYGKYRQTNIVDIFDESATYRDAITIPSKVYKKTSKFGLFYDITTETGEFDDDGVPIVEEVSTFTPQEILIKLFALKRKLKDYFLPLNARIIDIVGEAVYYATYNIKTWSDQTRIDRIELAMVPSYQVTPGPSGCIQDLRPLYHFGCPVGPDLTLGGTSNLYSWRIGIGNTAQVGGILNGIQTYRLFVDIPGGSGPLTLDTVISRDVVYGQTAYGPHEVADLIIATWRGSTADWMDKFNLYQEGGTSGVIRIVQTEPFGTGTIFASWFSNTTGTIPLGTYTLPGSTGGTATHIDISPGATTTFGPTGASYSYFEDCFVGYFDNWNTSVDALNDAPDIPVGYPIVLNNTTFDITWAQAEVSFNELDVLDPALAGPTATLLYSMFNIGVTTTGWTSTSTGITSGVTGFPTIGSSYGLYDWENVGFYSNYEMQWIVTKKEDDTPAFTYDSGRRGVLELDEHAVILPYEGIYSVELRIWDLYNSMSFIKDETKIEVCLPEIQIDGWYQKLEKEYTWNTRRIIPQSDYSRLDDRIKKVNDDLLWNEYDSSWNLPFHPNEEMSMLDIPIEATDSIEFYQRITDDNRHPLVDRNPYFYHRITYGPKWKDAYHLWWDGIGRKITQFGVTGCTSGATAVIFMTDENCPININDQSISLYYEEGPTGYTGATGATSLVGSSGDVIVSSANGYVYQYDGTTWNRVYATIDAYRLINPSNHSFTESGFKYMTYLLNEDLPSDGKTHSLLNEFIFYFGMKYNDDYSLIPFISGISKDYEKERRHRVRLFGLDGDRETYETTHYGYLGDIPNHFEIYRVDSFSPTGTIYMEGMSAPYAIGATNLVDLANELNGPTAQSDAMLGQFTYNIVLGYSGWTGPTNGLGPTTGYTEVKIVAAKKTMSYPDEIDIVLTGGIYGSNFGRSIINNPTWNAMRYLKYTQELPRLSLVNFTYDASRMYGKKNPVWKLTKESDPNFPDIYDRNQYFSFLFTERGSYTLTLELEDTNGNKQTVTKRELIKIV